MSSKRPMPPSKRGRQRNPPRASVDRVHGLAAHGTLKIASLAALVIAIGIACPSGAAVAQAVEVAAVVTFAVFAVVAFLADARRPLAGPLRPGDRSAASR